MNDYENAIEINGIIKQYDGFKLDGISFDLPKGGILGFIGQNGAGKTTTIKSILNITATDSGEIKIFGLDNIKHENEIKRHISAVFDEIPFHDSFTANAINTVMKGMYSEWDEKLYFSYLEKFGLPRKKKIGKLSKGMKMKLQIAYALSHNAKLLIMDEATTGLDPIVRSEILDIFREYLKDGERSILMSSHITSDIEKIADCVAFIDKGKILLSGYKDDIIENHGMIKCSKADFREIAEDDYISARTNDFGAEILVSDRAKAKRKYSGAVIEKASLEDIMLFYVNRDKKEWT